ncbi:hypothetical protein FNV43_RR03574 [Rhamnella rubrinervis]|uniref:Uncharacterized protein n=1 Tax=Rhamnella rubrinervis TaxID=2594499 RepID=A0A8K0MP79_9ROSA|nr:hypothetical protein FNV43_RR03574 [Rhamnella rubrinervis]
MPSQYILQRWTKNAKVGRVLDKSGRELNDIFDKLLMSRHSGLSQLFSIVADDASLTKEGTNLLRNWLDEVHSKIKKINVDKDIEQATRIVDAWNKLGAF